MRFWDCYSGDYLAILQYISIRLPDKQHRFTITLNFYQLLNIFI